MAARIVIGAETAECRNYRWTCGNALLEEQLNLMLSPLGPSGSDPNPDHTAARVAAERIGGYVVSYDPVKPAEGLVY